MKLKDVYICINCEELFLNGRNGCPSCGRNHYFPIAKWLGMIEDKERKDIPSLKKVENTIRREKENE